MEIFTVGKSLYDKSKVKHSLRKPENCPVCGKRYKTKGGKCVYCGAVLKIFHW